MWQLLVSSRGPGFKSRARRVFCTVKFPFWPRITFDLLRAGLEQTQCFGSNEKQDLLKLLAQLLGHVGWFIQVHIWTLNFSNIEPRQYLDGRPLENYRCCWNEFVPCSAELAQQNSTLILEHFHSELRAEILWTYSPMLQLHWVKFSLNYLKAFVC